MTRLTAGRLRIPCRSKRLRCSPSSLRRTGFPQFVRSALCSTSASPEHSGRDYLAAEASRLAIPGTEAVSRVADTLPDGSSREPPSSRWRRPDAALHGGDARIS